MPSRMSIGLCRVPLAHLLNSGFRRPQACGARFAVVRPVIAGTLAGRPLGRRSRLHGWLGRWLRRCREVQLAIGLRADAQLLIVLAIAGAAGTELGCKPLAQVLHRIDGDRTAAGSFGFRCRRLRPWHRRQRLASGSAACRPGDSVRVTTRASERRVQKGGMAVNRNAGADGPVQAKFRQPRPKLESSPCDAGRTSGHSLIPAGAGAPRSSRAGPRRTSPQRPARACACRASPPATPGPRPWR